MKVKFSMLLVLIVSMCYSQVENFTFEDLGLKTTVKEFKASHPSADLQPPQDIDDKIGIEQYIVRLETSVAALCSFLDDTLYSVGAFYSPEQCHTIGGMQTLYDALCKKLGIETTIENVREPNGVTQRITWEFNTIYFQLTGYDSEKTPMMFLFRNPIKFEEINKRRAAKANLGF